MSLRRLLEETVSEMEICIHALSSEFERPKLQHRNGHPAFRHEIKDDLLASFLKGVRIVNNLNAALVLLRAGYVQEVYVLCRLIDESGEDITFLASPLGKDGPSDDQIRYVKEFFQEEFGNRADPLRSQQKRDRVSRRRIHAALSRIPVEGSNPSRTQEIARTLHQAYSGFVHGAYSHIMDLYGGAPPKFHTNGMNGTPRISECEHQFVNYVYRSLLALEVIARRTNRHDITTRLVQQSVVLARETGCISEEGIKKAIKRMKIETRTDDLKGPGSIP
jgi:hypothetical protein